MSIRYILSYPKSIKALLLDIFLRMLHCYFVSGMTMISDERVQIALEELQDLKGVWNELLKIWEKVDEMKEQPWLSVQPRKVSDWFLVVWNVRSVHTFTWSPCCINSVNWSSSVYVITFSCEAHSMPSWINWRTCQLVLNSILRMNMCKNYWRATWRYVENENVDL